MPVTLTLSLVNLSSFLTLSPFLYFYFTGVVIPPSSTVIRQLFVAHPVNPMVSTTAGASLPTPSKMQLTGSATIVSYVWSVSGSILQNILNVYKHFKCL